jgi:hypothetical protein
VFRTVSIAVLVALIAPSFLIFVDVNPSTEARLPACCRRDGEHHCATMAVAVEPSSETQVKALPPVCPFRSQASSVAYATSYLPESFPAHFAGQQSHPSIHAQSHAKQRISEACSHQKRGPPPQLCS